MVLGPKTSYDGSRMYILAKEADNISVVTHWLLAGATGGGYRWPVYFVRRVCQDFILLAAAASSSLTPALSAQQLLDREW